MHFGHSMYWFTPSPGTLTVGSPIDAFFVFGFPLCLVPLLFLAYITKVSSHKSLVFNPLSRNQTIWVLLILAVVEIGASSHGTIDLDAVNNTAVVHMVTFGYPQTYRYSLTSVLGARVCSADESDALCLMLHGGAELQLTHFNQMRRKSEAAFAVNQFLQQNGGKGSLP